MTPFVMADNDYNVSRHLGTNLGWNTYVIANGSVLMKKEFIRKSHGNSLYYRYSFVSIRRFSHQFSGKTFI
jgi:hypothetical protein